MFAVCPVSELGVRAPELDRVLPLGVIYDRLGGQVVCEPYGGHGEWDRSVRVGNSAIV